MQQTQPQQQTIQSSSEYISDSDSDMFVNLAPQKNTSKASTQSEQKNYLAKMKRLMGDNVIDKNSKPTATTNKTENKNNKNNTTKPQSNQNEHSNDNVASQRERSREKNNANRKSPNQPTFSLNQTINNTANFTIQTQTKKQNINSKANEINNIKKQPKPLPSKFAEIEKQLLIPVDELPMIHKTIEEEKEQKRARKRFDRLMEKQLKQYKHGKVKDETSNCVFNGIEDYFM